MKRILPYFCITGVFEGFESLVEKYGVIKTIKAESIIYGATEYPIMSVFIKKGLAKLMIVNENGNEETLYFLGEKTIYPTNPYDMLGTDERAFVFTAITDLEVISFKNKDIFKMMEECHEFSLSVYRMMGMVINALCSMRILNSYKNSDIKICSFIYLCCTTAPALSLSQDQIGKMVGLSRREVCRVLGDLRNEGIISTRRNRIEILDESRLLKLCSDVCCE